jgi:hypothetical protein
MKVLEYLLLHNSESFVFFMSKYLNTEMYRIKPIFS